MTTSIIILYIVGLSFSFQILTVILSFRLIFVTRWKKAWLLVSIGLITMGIRRLMTFTDILSGDIIYSQNAITEVAVYEIIGLIGSIIMLAGVMFIKPFFLSIKAANEELSKLMQEQKAILDNVNLGISKIIDRKQVWVNSKTEELFQYTKEEMTGQTTRKLYPSEEAYEKLGREAYPVLAEGLPYTTEQKLIRKDGKEIWVKYTGKAVEPPNMSKGTIWMLQDITEHRKLDEERERLLAELQKAFADIKTLQGILPVCSYCKRIKDEKGNWGRLDSYIVTHTDAEISHGMCPECAEKVFKEIEDFNKKQGK